MKTLHLYARLARSVSEKGSWTINHGQAIMIVYVSNARLRSIRALCHILTYSTYRLAPPSENGGRNLLGKLLARIIRITATLCHSKEEQRVRAPFGSLYRQ